jgi:hypothetical protein
MQLKIAAQLAGISYLTIAGWSISISCAHASNLPPITDIPEEVLRAEIITEARSPIDGKPLSAAEFAELVVTVERQNDLANATSATKNPEIRNILFLIRLRGFLKSVGVPIK